MQSNHTIIIILVIIIIIYFMCDTKEKFSSGGALIQLIARDPQDSHQIGNNVSNFNLPYSRICNDPYYPYVGRVPKRYRCE